MSPLKAPALSKRLKKTYEEAASKYWYGNTLPYWANAKGVNNWKACRKAFQGPFDQELHRQFMKNGFAVLSHGIDLQAVQRVQQRFQEVIQDREKSYNVFDNPKTWNAYNHGNYQGEIPETRRYVKDTHLNIPNYTDLLSDELVHLITSCYGSPFEVDGLESWRNSYCPPEILKDVEAWSNRWHFDSQIADRTKLFIYLSDVPLTHGPFHNLSKPYSRELLMKGFHREARKTSETGGLPATLFEEPHVYRHSGPVGSVILCATSFCLHRAGDLTEPGATRDVIEFSLRPAFSQGNVLKTTGS